MFCIFVTGLLYAYNKLVRKRGMTLEEARQHYWKHGLITQWYANGGDLSNARQQYMGSL